jgi:ABC-type phosphate transport system substrate-binding protein
VHVSNPTKQLSKQELSQLFLKKVTQWKDSHEAVLPIDLVDNSPVRQKFSESIHGREVAYIKAYWQKQIFSGREVPPEEKKSEEEVLKYVSENPGAVGYIAAATKIDAYTNVKVVEIANNK